MLPVILPISRVFRIISDFPYIFQTILFISTDLTGSVLLPVF